MDASRSRYKQVGAKFRSAEDSRAARAIAHQDVQRTRRSTAVHARRNIPDDLTPVNTPEPATSKAPQTRLTATVALANVRAKIAQLAPNRTAGAAPAVKESIPTVAKPKTTTATKMINGKSIEQLAKERMEALKIYKQRKQKQLEREKQTRKPNFWLGISKRKEKVLLLPNAADSNSSKLATPGCTPSKQSRPVWHSGFSSISKKNAPQPSSSAQPTQPSSRNSRSSSRNLFSRGNLDQVAQPRLQHQRQSQRSVASSTGVSARHRDAEEQFRPIHPDSFAPTGYTFTAPDGLHQPHHVSAAVSSRRPSTIRFSKEPVLPATPSGTAPKRMPSSKTPRPGAPEARVHQHVTAVTPSGPALKRMPASNTPLPAALRPQSRSASQLPIDSTTVSPRNSPAVKPVRSNSVRSRKKSSDSDAHRSTRSSSRGSFLDESEQSNVSSNSTHTERGSKRKESASIVTPSKGDKTGALSSFSSFSSLLAQQSANTSDRDSLGIEALEASPPTVARFKRKNPVHQLHPISGAMATETVAVTARADGDSSSRSRTAVGSERDCFDAADDQQNVENSELVLHQSRTSIEDGKENMPKDCSLEDVFNEPSNKQDHLLPVQSPGSTVFKDRSMKRKSSLASLPPAKKSKMMDQSETSVLDDLPLQPEPNQSKSKRSSRSSGVNSTSSLVDAIAPQPSALTATPHSADVEAETKSSNTKTPQSNSTKSLLGKAPKSSDRRRSRSINTPVAQAINSSSNERSKSAGGKSTLKNTASPPTYRPKENNLQCSPQLKQTQGRISSPKALDNQSTDEVPAEKSDSGIESAKSPVASDSNVDETLPQTPVKATPKPGRKAASSLRKSVLNSVRRSSRLSCVADNGSPSHQERSDTACVTPNHASQRLTATTPCSRSTRRSLAVHADSTWQEYCTTTPSVTKKTPGKKGRRKTVQVEIVSEEEPPIESAIIVADDRDGVTKDAVMGHEQTSVATFKTPQSSGRGRIRRGTTSALSKEFSSPILSGQKEKGKKTVEAAPPAFSFLSNDTSTDDAPRLPSSSPPPSASEQGLSTGSGRCISRVSWMVRESPFINHESRSAKRRKAAERRSLYGDSPFDMVFTAQDLSAAATGCSPSLPSANSGPSDEMAELLRPSTPCFDQPASPDVWANMSASSQAADPASDPLSITQDPEDEDKVSSNSGNAVTEDSSSVESDQLPDIVLSSNDQSQTDDNVIEAELVVAAEMPAPANRKNDTPRRGKRGSQSLAVAAALESSRRALEAAATTNQENRPPRVSFAPDAHTRVSLGLFAPGALATPAASGSVAPEQDLICWDSPKSSVSVPTVTLGEDLISLDTPSSTAKKGGRGRRSRVSQLAALYESPSPNTPRPALPNKTATPATLRRSTRRSVLTPRSDNLA